MFNAYTLIIGLFTLGGLVTVVWGAVIIVRARNTARWPAASGTIEESAIASEDDDLLPNIVFRYAVNGSEFRRTLEFPGGITPTRELAAEYLGKYPAGAAVTVYYDPRAPGTATLEPGLARGDWLVLAFGVGASLLGISMLLMG